jgi:hypothetical protein
MSFSLPVNKHRSGQQQPPEAIAPGSAQHQAKCDAHLSIDFVGNIIVVLPPCDLKLGPVRLQEGSGTSRLPGCVCAGRK